MLQKDGDIDEDVSHRIKAGWKKCCQASSVNSATKANRQVL